MYRGSDDDEALNLSMQRYQSAEEAVASLSADADPTGVVSIPIMGMHVINDPVLFVEQESLTCPVRTSPTAHGDESVRDSLPN